MSHFSNGQQSACYALVVPRKQVKSVKTTLESLKLASRQLRIWRLDRENDDVFAVPTCLPMDSSDTQLELSKPVELSDMCYQVIVVQNAPIKPILIQGNALEQALSQSLFYVCPSLSEALKCDLLRNRPTSYCIYEPMLLLPGRIDPHAPFARLLDMLKSQGLKDTYFRHIAMTMHVTHVALNAAIPSHRGSDENLLRSPTDLQPLLGDFGPFLPPFPIHIPSTFDFDRAFWVSKRQNGIKQIWAPRYTMFSAGNVTEKARILNLETVKRAVDEGKKNAKGCVAVDLFAGIGYFAFSYLKAGVQNVLCWDLNPWSIEGLRRGARTNKWSVRMMKPEDDQGLDPAKHGKEMFDLNAERLLVFCESNTNAAGRITGLRSKLPPIRHVNCGMLPTANAAWKTAVQVIDPDLGGWLHLHETVHESKMEAHILEIVCSVNKYFHVMSRSENLEQEVDVFLEHVEKVKSMGPRLQHIVLDIWISSRQGPVEVT